MTMFILAYELGVGNVIMEALGWLSAPQWVRQVGCQETVHGEW